MHTSRDLAGLVERLSHCSYTEGYRDGLKPAQWSALRYFSNANRFSKTTSAFACYQGTTLGAASQTIGALVDKRLLKRTPDKTDKRRHHLTLTAKAKKLIGSDPIRVLIDAAHDLDETERIATADGLEKMLIRLMQRKGSAFFGYCEHCRFLKCVRGGGRPSWVHQCKYVEDGLTLEDLDKICINYEPGGAEGA